MRGREREPSKLRSGPGREDEQLGLVIDRGEPRSLARPTTRSPSWLSRSTQLNGRMLASTSSSGPPPGKPAGPSAAPQRNTLRKPHPPSHPLSPSLRTPTSPAATRPSSQQASTSDLQLPRAGSSTGGGGARLYSTSLSRTGSTTGGGPPAHALHASPSVRSTDGWGAGGAGDSNTGRASPALSTRSSGASKAARGSQQGSSSNIGRSLESYSTKHVVAALDSGEGMPGGGGGAIGDEWSAVCVRVLPLL